jgi:DNA-binding CsgD family transcriptional regulator
VTRGSSAPVSIVGRERELEAIDSLLGATRAGNASMVFARGEPGIGKTRLLAELETRADSSGCLVLSGSAAQFERELPFGPLVDAIDAYVRSLGPHVIDRLAADGQRELAEVFPALRTLRSPQAVPPPAAERFRTYFAIRDLLERLAARQPLVLVLDDLHWADVGTLEFLEHLLRRPADGPVLVAGAFRSGAIDSVWLRSVEGAASNGQVRLIDVGPLSAVEATALVQISDQHRREVLLRESGGNPFYLLQLSTFGGYATSESDTVPIAAPPAVAASIAGELDALSSLARAFVAAAAVVGDPFDFDLTAETASVDTVDAAEAIDELTARDLVRVTPVPRRFRFRHPLVRSAVYESSSLSSRWAAHARCAEALGERAAPADVRAHHVEQSARPGDPRAVELLTEAAATTAHRAPSASARWLDAAIRVVPPDIAPVERITLLQRSASAHAAAGSLVEARDRLLQAIELAADDAEDMRVGLITACASVEQRIGRHDDAHNRLVATLDSLGEQTVDRVSMLVALADDCFYRVEYEAMKQWAEQAVGSLPSGCDDILRAAAHGVLALADAFAGDTDAAAQHRNLAAELVDALPDDVVATRLDVLGHLAGTEVYLDRYEETWTHAQRGIRLARATGQSDVFPMLYPCGGVSGMLLGNLVEAAEILDSSVEAARLTDNTQNVAWGLLNRALCATMAGDLDTARASAEQSVALMEELGGDTFIAQLAGLIFGWVLCEDGKAGPAIERLVGAGGGDDLPRVGGGWRTSYLEVLVRAHLALGRTDDARYAADRAVAVGEQLRLPRSKAMAHRARALVALVDGDHVLALELADASIAGLEECASRIDAARSRVVRAHALAPLGRLPDAAAELQRASQELDRFGAVRYRDEADQQLGRLGLRVHRRSAPGSSTLGVGALSGREREVARLVVDRRTNSEIAAELFLSLKTVETHLRNIFRKLGVSSRVEVARLVQTQAPA